MTTQNGKRPTRTAAQPSDSKRVKDRALRMKKVAPQLAGAEAELRRHAAEWLAAIRSRIAGIWDEVGRVKKAAEDPGNVLSRVLDAHQLGELSCQLELADQEATGLTLRGVDLPVPDLLEVGRYVCGTLFPLAEEGAKLFAEPAKGTD